MTVKETNIFDFLYDKLYFDINKPIRLFEAFSGIGTQTMALKRLGYQVDHIGISEWYIPAIKSYHTLHGNKGIEVNYIDDIDYLISYLMKLNLSFNDKDLAKESQYKRMGLDKLNILYKQIKQTINYGGIGSFERMPKDIDICSWSFPCQDISLAGKQRGMVDGSRSNYGYVFLDTIENTPYEERPKVLLMENVKTLLSKTFSEDWKEINLRLERLGYKNYADSLIATDFGIPQTRDRVFIVSIKGEYSYTFPKPFKLQKKLKDYLETKVDEKYYISDKMMACLTDMTDRNGFVRGKTFKPHPPESEYAYTITTSGGNRSTDNFIIVPEATKKGYTLAEEGDGVYLDRPHQKRGVVQKDKIQTIKTSENDIGVVVKETENYLEVVSNPPLRIRKLTPLESWRLMGIDDEDFYKAKASGVSDSQLYKQAGNAIVVDVLYYIFKQFIKGERK